MGVRHAPSADLRGMRWCAQVKPLPSACQRFKLSFRNLGRHISFVQGLFNDDWTDENLAAFTKSAGNELRNQQVLEYHVPPSVLKPNPQSQREARERYIIAKCVRTSRFAAVVFRCYMPQLRANNLHNQPLK